MSLPGGALPFPKFQMFTNLGAPAAGYKLAFYVAGTSTPLATYSNSALTVANTNPVILDSAGRATVYLLPTGYKVVYLTDADVVVWTQDNVFPSTIFDDNIGYYLQVGSRDVTSNYIVTSSDIFVTVASTGGADPCVVNLPSALDRGMPVFVKNVGTIDLAIRPNGSDTIDNNAGDYSLAAAADPNFPTILLFPDKVSNWWVMGKFE